MVSDKAIEALVITGLVATLISVAAWVTHVYVCFKAAEWGFLLAGAFAFPVAVVYGIGIWFGVW